MRADPRLDHVHGLLLQPAGEQPALEGLLAGLAGAFQAFAAGLANLADDCPSFRYPAPPEKPASLPWQDDPAFFRRGGPVPGVVCQERSGGSLLAAAVQGADGAAWVLWLEDPIRTTWTDAEAGPWPWPATRCRAGWAVNPDRAGPSSSTAPPGSSVWRPPPPSRAGWPTTSATC